MQVQLCACGVPLVPGLGCCAPRAARIAAARKGVSPRAGITLVRATPSVRMPYGNMPQATACMPLGTPPYKATGANAPYHVPPMRPGHGNSQLLRHAYTLRSLKGGGSLGYARS